METTKSTPCNIIFVLGPPGSGKGTICEAVAGLRDQHCRILHLSVGDYLRKLCDPKTSCRAGNYDRGKIRDYLKESKLLPADVLIPVLKHKIESTQDWDVSDVVWLIDGFPRDMENARAFEEQIGKPGKVIVLDCWRVVAQRRYLSRAREAVDDEERFNKRYREYVENMKPLREYYAGLIGIVHVDGTHEQSQDAFLRMLPRVGGKK